LNTVDLDKGNKAGLEARNLIDKYKNQFNNSSGGSGISFVFVGVIIIIVLSLFKR
jgi:hypothetical protein